VSSVRALQLFLRKTARLDRLPDFVVIEGPLAGGHLGFGMDWAQYDLATIVTEMAQFLKTEQLDIPLIAAGGIFTGSDATHFLENGAAAFRWPPASPWPNECGLPDKVKQEYFKASEEDIVVNTCLPPATPCACCAIPRPLARAFAPTARPMAICSMAMAAVPTSMPITRKWRHPPRWQEHFGARQDLPVHPHAQLQLLDLRQHHLPPQRYYAQAGRWHIPDPERRTHFQGLPVQRGQPDPAARLRPDNTMTTPTTRAYFPG
jgi:hypothetical protein